MLTPYGGGFLLPYKQRREGKPGETHTSRVKPSFSDEGTEDPREEVTRPYQCCAGSTWAWGTERDAVILYVSLIPS